jgi:hypothetical protein
LAPPIFLSSVVYPCDRIERISIAVALAVTVATGRARREGFASLHDVEVLASVQLHSASHKEGADLEEAVPRSMQPRLLQLES